MARTRTDAVPRHYLGVDPGGSSGGFALINHSGSLCWACKMPDSWQGIVDVVFEARACGQITAMLEHVHAMPRQGVSSTFKFGANFGALHMALTAVAVPYRTVAPLVWQKAMDCLTGGDKRITRDRASAMHPEIQVTHAIADALLIAEYARRLDARVPSGTMSSIKGRTR